MHIAVNCLVIDASLKFVPDMIGVSSSRLANPYPFEYIIYPFSMIVSAAPGPFARL